VLVVSAVSQPLLGSLSQLPKPLEQLEIPHDPLTQLGVSLLAEQAWPQLPQLEREVLVFVSQPLAGLPSQSAKPLAQTGLQAPDPHEVVPFWFVHFVVHDPQCEPSVARFVSQPSEWSLLQSAKVPAQAPNWQLPVEQEALALVKLQETPQAAQLVSVLVCSQPVPSQLPYPVEQPEMPQVPPMQLGLPLVAVQAVVQAPQWFTLVCVLVSQPFFGSPSQSA
jgi:hypothetical protein